MKRALLASKNQAVNEPLVNLLEGEYRFDSVGDKTACLQLLAKNRYDLLIIDLSMIDGPRVDEEFRREVERLRHSAPSMLTFVLCPRRRAAAAIPLGSVHYLTYPVPSGQLRSVVGQILQASNIETELSQCRSGFLPADYSDLVAFSSSRMKIVLERARAVATMDTSVMLTGETGTGKGVLSRMIHCWSRRRDKPFVSVQCSAIPDTLLESELFGHERGAFTDAVRTRSGKFEAAQGGTLLLDEIGTISVATQVKLLQVLQEKSFHRVGGEEEIKANLRIIAATNSDLKLLITQGAFRRDLYYRLNVFPIELPALRDRREDIPALAHAFLRKLNRTYPKNVLSIDPRTLDALQRYSWPGNIRELENLIERAYVLEPQAILTPDYLSFESADPSPDQAPEGQVDPTLPWAQVRASCLEHAARTYLCKLLAVHRGRMAETASAAGIGVRQLHKLLTRYGIRKESFHDRK